MPLSPVCGSFNSRATRSRAQPPKSQKASRADQLERLSADLDLLIQAERLGTRSHAQVERHIDQAETIADGIRAVYRGEGRPSAPMLGREGTGIWF